METELNVYGAWKGPSFIRQKSSVFCLTLVSVLLFDLGRPYTFCLPPFVNGRDGGSNFMWRVGTAGEKYLLR